MLLMMLYSAVIVKKKEKKKKKNVKDGQTQTQTGESKSDFKRFIRVM